MGREIGTCHLYKHTVVYTLRVKVYNFR